MENVNVYLKTEPAGEYSFGEITKEELIEEGFDFETGEFEDEDDFLFSRSIEYNDITSEYGCVLYNAYKDELGNMFTNLDTEKIDWNKINVIVENDKSYKKLHEAGNKYFLQHSGPTKYSMDFDLNVDIKDFKPELLTIKLMCISFPCEDSYGEIEDFYIMNDFTYDGESYNDDMYDSLDDRGYDREISIIKTDSVSFDGEFDWERIYSNVED